MKAPVLCWIVPVSSPGYPDHTLPGGGGEGIWPGPGYPTHPIQPVPPGSPGSPQHPIYIPGAPPGSAGSPEHPIYITGIPSHPIVVVPPLVPSQGLPGYPDQGLPVPPGQLPGLPEVPPELASSIVVAVHKPGQPWVVKTYPVGPSHPIPPTPDQGLPPEPPPA